MMRFTLMGFVEGVGRVTEAIVLGALIGIVVMVAVVVTCGNKNDDEEVASH